MKMIFYFHANITHFHKKGFALGLVLRVRVFWNSERAYFHSFFLTEEVCIHVIEISCKDNCIKKLSAFALI